MKVKKFLSAVTAAVLAVMTFGGVPKIIPETNEIIEVSAEPAVPKSDGSVTRFENEVTLSSDTVVTGDLLLTEWETVKNGQTVKHEFESLDLNGYTLTVYGNLLQTLGRVRINNGTLNVSGDYKIQNAVTNNVGEIEYNMCYAGLNSYNKYDKITIGGNFEAHNLDCYKDYDYGVIMFHTILTINGNIYIDNTKLETSQTDSDEGQKTILTQKGVIKICLSIDSNYYKSQIFNQLVVQYPDESTVEWENNIGIRKLESDINIIPKNLHKIRMDINQQNVFINGDVNMEDGNIDINGGTLTFNGNLTQEKGTIDINNGTLNVLGDYKIQNAVTNNVGEIEYKNCEASLVSQNKHDKINIGGNFETHNVEYWCNFIYTALTIGGDVYLDGRIFFSSENGQKTKLTKSGTINICSDYGTNERDEEKKLTFNELEIPNADNVVWEKSISVRKLLTDINITPKNLENIYIDLNQKKLTINGDVEMEYGDIDINDGILTINGNLIQKGDEYHITTTININNGTLNILGDYKIQNAVTNNVGEIEYKNCEASLVSQNKHDKINIGGNFETHKNYYPILKYTTLTVGGNIWADELWFDTENGQKTILNGKNRQSVYLPDNKFNILELTKPKSNYTFEPDYCWVTLIEPVVTTTPQATTTTTTTITTTTATSTTTTSTTSTTPIITTTEITTTTPAVQTIPDINDDGKTDTDDVKQFQKFLVNKIKLTIEEILLVDMNNDGKLNVFDLLIMKKRLH